MKLDIVKWPSSVLKQRSTCVVDLDRARLEQLIANMTETMMAAGGVGLSAIQVGVPLAVVVTRFPGFEVLINPHVETHEAVTVQDLVGAAADGAKLVRAPIGKLVEVSEGCLSLPGIFETVKRYNQVRVYTQTLDSLSSPTEAATLVNPAAFYRLINDTPLLATSTAAQCVQHELEHLRGEFFLDRLTSARRDAIRARLRSRR